MMVSLVVVTVCPCWSWQKEMKNAFGFFHNQYCGGPEIRLFIWLLCFSREGGAASALSFIIVYSYMDLHYWMCMWLSRKKFGKVERSRNIIFTTEEAEEKWKSGSGL